MREVRWDRNREGKKETLTIRDARMMTAGAQNDRLYTKRGFMSDKHVVEDRQMRASKERNRDMGRDEPQTTKTTSTST